MPAIYFDTNPLKGAGWPKVSASLRRLADLARVMKVDLFLPEPVEMELEESWIREFQTKRRTSANAVTDLQKYAAEIVAIPKSPELITSEAARPAYQALVATRKADLAIATVPITTRPLRDFVALAAARRPPFKGEDKGFRDSVILWTIVEHVKSTGFDACALVTEDGDFDQAEVQQDAKSAGVQIDVYKTINELVDYMLSLLKGAVQEIAEKDQESALQTLRDSAREIELAIGQLLVVTDQDLFVLGGSLRRLERIELAGIKNVRTPVPPPEASGEVALSFDAEVRLHAIIDRFPTRAPRPLKIGEDVGPTLRDLIETPTAVPREEIYRRDVEVEAKAMRDGAGRYRDVKVEAVRFKPSIVPPGLSLSSLLQPE